MVIIPNGEQQCYPLFPYTTLFRSVSLRVSGCDNHSIHAAGVRQRFAVGLGWPIVVPLGAGCVRGERNRSEEHTSELQSRFDLVCRLLLDNKNNSTQDNRTSEKLET